MSAPLADPNCERCGGLGWVRVEDEGAGAARLCDCSLRNRIPANLEAASIPPQYAGCSFRNFLPEPDSKTKNLWEAQRLCEQYVDSFLGLDGPTRKGLLLMGPPGVGKTHLAVSVLKSLIERYGVRARFLDFSSFISRLQASFDGSNPETRQGLMAPVLSADVLVFDELAAQKMTPFVQDLLYLIVNGRYGRQLPTIYTTNFRLDSGSSSKARRWDEEPTEGLPFNLADRPASDHDLLSSRLPPALLSRIVGESRAFEIRSEDFRQRNVTIRGSKVS